MNARPRGLIHRELQFLGLGLVVLILGCDSTAIAESDNTEMITVIEELHAAYEQRDVSAILNILQERNKNAAESYGQPVNAFVQFERQYHQQLFSSPKWEVLPLNVTNLDFTIRDNEVIVSSDAPILASPQITIEGGFLIIEYESLTFQKQNGQWVIIGAATG